MPSPTHPVPSFVRRAAHRALAFQVETMERRVLLSAGDLDPSFDGNGLLTTEFPAVTHRVDAALALPGGKFLVGAEAGGAYTVSRFNPDGSYDRSFGTGGKVTGYGSNGMTLAPDGKILVPGAGFGVARYNANGTVDTTFARGGADGDGVFTFGAPYQSTGRAVAVRPDGKILLAGFVEYEFDKFDYRDMLALARLNPDGTPDTTFGGGDGIVLASDRDLGDEFNGPVVLSGSKLLFAGYVGNVYGVHRFNDDLTVDTGFGGGDGVATDVGFFGVGDVNVAPDGRIVLAGEIRGDRDPSYVEMALSRLTPDGRLDTSFGGDGVVRDYYGGSYQRMYDAAVRADGSIVALTNFGAISFRPDGSPDPSFSGDGVAPFTFASPPEEFAGGGAVALAADGALFGGVAGGQLSIVRLNATGSLDPAFSGDGRLLTRFPARAAASDVLVQPDGKVLTAGDAGGRMALARYNPDGTLDRSFGRGGADGDGRLTVQTAPALTLAGLPDNKFLALHADAVGRFNPDGSADTTFGDGGWATFPGRATSMTVLPGGKVIVAGSFFTGGFREYNADGILLARYNADGTPDTTFGASGFVQADVDTFGTPLLVSEATNVTAGPDGRVYVTSTLTPPGQFVVARFTKSGAVDRSFGTRGLTALDMAAGAGGESADAIALGDDGKVLVSGSAAGRATVMRLRADGSVDPSFGGGDGILTGPAGAFADVLAVGGRVLAAGTSAGDFLVARYNADGTPDVSFGKARTGAVRANFGATDAAAAVALGPDGSIVAAGPTGGLGSFKFAVAKFKGDGVTWPLTYQAESAQVSGAKVAADHPGYTGAGFVDYVNRSGDFVEFAVSVPQAGVYDLSFRYANGNASARALGLKVNGDVTPTPVTFAGTGSWSQWAAAPALVTLKAGANALRLTAVGSSGPNLDSVTLSPHAVAAGAVDPTFGGPAGSRIDFGGSLEGWRRSDSASDLLALPDGKYLAVGSVGNDRGGDFALVRYNANGAPDATFGGAGTGVVRTDFGGEFGDRADAAALLPDGKVLVAGLKFTYTPIGDGDFEIDNVLAVSQYLADGRLDPAFGDAGKLAVESWDEGFGDGGGQSLAVLPDRSFLVAYQGFRHYSATGGLVAGPQALPPVGEVVAKPAVAVTPQGKVIVAARSLRRLNPDLTPDASFGGGDGVVPLEFDALALATAPDGKILVCGRTGSFTSYAAVLARFNADGSPDPTFGGGDGVVTADFGASADYANDLAMLPDGKVAVALGGDPLAYGGVPSEFAVARFTVDGRLDPSFGTGGRASLAGAAAENSANAVAVDAAGRIVVAGSIGGDFTVARFFG